MTNPSQQTTLITAQTISRELDVSPATLLRWTNEFATYLSSEASTGRNKSYTYEDLNTLLLIKALMGQGLTYDEVRQKLATNVQAQPTEWWAEDEPSDEDSTALMAPNGGEGHAITFLTNTLSTLSDTQQSILNSQTANRELLGVLIQDNFNLKEENSRLRERLLELERTAAQNRRDLEQYITQVRQEEEWRYEALRREFEAKLAAVRQAAAQAVEAAQSVEIPEYKAVQEKSGCLGALFGGGEIKLVPTTRRRKTAQEAGAGQRRSASTAGSANPSHPRPRGLPE